MEEDLAIKKFYGVRNPRSPFGVIGLCAGLNRPDPDLRDAALLPRRGAKFETSTHDSTIC